MKTPPESKGVSPHLGAALSLLVFLADGIWIAETDFRAFTAYTPPMIFRGSAPFRVPRMLQDVPEEPAHRVRFVGVEVLRELSRRLTEADSWFNYRKRP